MTWEVDFTQRARSDLVGLDAVAGEAVIDALVDWTSHGPPRDNQRTILGITFVEVTVAEAYLMAYVIDDERERFAVMWLRTRPGT